MLSKGDMVEAEKEPLSHFTRPHELPGWASLPVSPLESTPEYTSTLTATDQLLNPAHCHVQEAENAGF